MGCSATNERASRANKQHSTWASTPGAATAAASVSGAGSGKRRWGREVVEFRARFPHFPRRLEPGAAGRVLAARARLEKPLEPESAQPRGPQELCGRRFAFSSPGAGTRADRDSAREGAEPRASAVTMSGSSIFGDASKRATVSEAEIFLPCVLRRPMPSCVDRGLPPLALSRPPPGPWRA